MGFDLSGVRIPVEAKALDEFLGIHSPVDFRVGGQVGIVVAHSAIDLAQKLGFTDLLYLSTQPMNHVGQLFANGGGRGCLAVGTG